MKQITDLQAWEILKLSAELGLSWPEACRMCGVRLSDFLDYLMASGALAEALRRLDPASRKRLDQIARAAVGVAFADNPAEMLEVMRELDISQRNQAEV